MTIEEWYDEYSKTLMSYVTYFQVAKDAWDYKQKEIDELKEELAKINKMHEKHDRIMKATKLSLINYKPMPKNYGIDYL